MPKVVALPVMEGGSPVPVVYPIVDEMTEVKLSVKGGSTTNVGVDELAFADSDGVTEGSGVGDTGPVP